jgi:hypothetical protein
MHRPVWLGCDIDITSAAKTFDSKLRTREEKDSSMISMFTYR